jgi:hypothetical protein
MICQLLAPTGSLYRPLKQGGTFVDKQVFDWGGASHTIPVSTALCIRPTQLRHAFILGFTRKKACVLEKETPQETFRHMCSKPFEIDPIFPRQ